MSSDTVIGKTFYDELGLPWIDRLADQAVGGGLAWASGELPVLVVLIAVLVQWARQDEREARRRDRHADRDGDRELVDYNTMLRELARTGRAGPGDDDAARAPVDDDAGPPPGFGTGSGTSP